MSGILGRCELSGRPIGHAPFLSAFDAIGVYGEDQSETWIGDSHAVGRHLLRISPASAFERLTAPVDGLIVVADAILDNRPELARALDLSTGDLAKMSDTELIRRSFLKWGKDCVHYLLGDFAFAVFNENTKQIFLARDHVGSRPLFWSRRDETLLFGTAVEGLTAFTEWPWSIDERTITEWLFDPLFPVSKPFFREINDVPAGGFLWADGSAVSTGRWWRPSTRSVRCHKSDAEAAEACRALLDQAIGDRVATDGNVSAHFSGGVDSTGVALIAAQTLRSHGRNLTRGYAWSPPISERYPADTAHDERKRILEIARPNNIPIAFGEADSATFLPFISRPFEFEGEADLADEIPTLRAAQKDKVRVLLSGWGGDEAFSAHGHGYLASLVLRGDLTRASAFARYHNPSLRKFSIILGLLWHQVLYPLLPQALYYRFAPTRSYMRYRSFISKRLLELHGRHARARGSHIKFGPNPNENLLRNITAGHVTMRMESWAAWSAPYGFQYRYPLTDKRLLEFLFTLPPDQLFANNQPRGLARAALADCVPASCGKADTANEALRRNTRCDSWEVLARQVIAGGFDDDCPWLDTNNFRAIAQTPQSQDTGEGVLTFAQVVTAARVWSLHRRGIANGWAD